MGGAGGVGYREEGQNEERASRCSRDMIPRGGVGGVGYRGEGQYEGRDRGDAVEIWYRGEGQEGWDTEGRGSTRRGQGGAVETCYRGEGQKGCDTEGVGQQLLLSRRFCPICLAQGMPWLVSNLPF